MFRRSVAVLLTALLFVTAGCGDDSDTTSDPGETAGDPVVGGVLTIGQYSEPAGLDPVMLPGGGTVGGIELAAIYDTIVRYNVETNEYEPRTAESFEPNDDYSEWTLTLRDGITFTDGTPYDADAVAYNLERHMAPDSRSAMRGILAATLSEYDVVDEHTVRFTLKTPWSGFPYIFAQSAGMIASPTAIEQAGETFNTDPGDAGAGAFKVDSYRPGEGLRLVRNDAYYGGDVYLDGVNFVLRADPNVAYEALRAGELQAAFLRDPLRISQAKDSGFGTIDMPEYTGNVALMNSGVVSCQGGNPTSVCAGKADGTEATLDTATADIRVRRAVAMAIDTSALNERVWDGEAFPGSSVFQDTFQWDPGVPGVEYDPDAASRLVDEAKADGWDGRIRVAASNDPVGRAWATAVSTMLEAVGMDVQTQSDTDIQQIIQQVFVSRDYDVVNWALGLLQDRDSVYPSLLANLHSSGLRYGFVSDDMDSAIEAVREATTDDEYRDAMAQVSEAWNSDMPAAVTAAMPQAWISNASTHGFERSAVSIILLDKAWMQP